MRLGLGRLVLLTLSIGLLGLAAYGADLGYWLLTTDDPDGGAHSVGLMVFPSALFVGLLGFVLFAFAIRR